MPEPVDDARITCPSCQQRLVTLAHACAASRYRVGNPLKPALGHALYGSEAGRITLCTAGLRPEETRHA